MESNFLPSPVKFDSLYFYNISKVKSLTFISTRGFTRFISNPSCKIGTVLGPNSLKKHLIVTLSNTTYSTGFMLSHCNVSKTAGFLKPGTFINPNILIDTTKIKYYSRYRELTETLALYITIAGIKPFILKPNNINAVIFEASNFSSIDQCTGLWGPKKLIHTPQKTILAPLAKFIEQTHTTPKLKMPLFDKQHLAPTYTQTFELRNRTQQLQAFNDTPTKPVLKGVTQSIDHVLKIFQD